MFEIPDTYFTVQEQTTLFLFACLLGLPMGLLFDLFRMLRVLFRHAIVVVAIEDILFWCGHTRCIHFRCLSGRVSPLLSGRYAPRLPALAVHGRQFPAENYPKNCRFSPPFFITDIPSGCGIFCTNTMENQAKISSCYTKSQKKEKKCPHSLDCRPPFVV